MVVFSNILNFFQNQYFHIINQIHMTQNLKPFQYLYTENPKSNILLVFLQGWPDSYQVWDYLKTQIYLNQYSILKINFPNHGKEQISWGNDFELIVDRLKITIDEIKNIQKRILIAHDFGCLYGYMLDQRYQKYFQTIVALDAAPQVQFKTFREKIFVFAYQFYLIVAFFIGGSIGKQMTKGYAKMYGHDDTLKYFKSVDSSRNYPFYYFWKNYLVSIFNRRKRYLYRYVPSVPVIYFYGKIKPTQFHSDNWLKYLEETEGCQARGLQTGHWIMRQYKSFIRQAIIRVANRIQ